MAAIAIGVLLTWANDGPVSLGGIDGPNDGWLVLIVSLFALGWIPSLARRSWIGTIGVFGAALVIADVAVSAMRETRDVLDGSPGVGVVVVLVGAVVLAGCAASTAVALARRPGRLDGSR